MKTIKDINKARELETEITIRLSNGKDMIIDFYNNTIMRYNKNGNGLGFGKCEQTRDFYFDTNKMYNLAKSYLKKQ